MHRIFAMPWLLMGGVAALLLGGLPAVSPAQTCSPESRPLVVLLNGTTRLQLSSKKPIKTVINPKDALLSLRTVERDPTTVLLVGTAPGITRIELEDADGNRELRTVIIQADVEYLTSQLKRAVPLSNIDVIPNGISSVILTGYTTRAEDIAVLQAVATSVGFQVINGVRLDGVQQVQLDVVVARVNRNKGRNFGFNFVGNARSTIYGSTVGNIASGVQTVAVGVPSSVLQPSGFGQVVNALPGQGNIFGGVIGNAAGFLGFLEALQTEGLAKLLAQPRLIAKSGLPASFLDGGEQAVPVPAGLGQIGVQFEEFGTRLNFLPIVLGNGRIHLEVEPEVSALSAGNGVTIGGTTVPGRVTQRVHTTVEMETGQTFVIGGLIQKDSTVTTTKVPYIGQLPFLGALFSTKTASESETELVIMVTPHLIDAQSACQVAKVLPGQESRTPDNFELFLEGILEAPRGPRRVFHGNRYVPAHLNGPTANLFPCGGQDDGIHTQRISQRGGLQSGAGCAPVEVSPISGPAGTMPAAGMGTTPEGVAPGMIAPTGTPRLIVPSTTEGKAPGTLPRGEHLMPQTIAPPPMPLRSSLSVQTPSSVAAPGSEPEASPGIRLADPVSPPDGTPKLLVPTGN